MQSSTGIDPSSGEEATSSGPASEAQDLSSSTPAPAGGLQAETEKALAEQRAAFEKALEDATGYRTLAAFSEAQRQAQGETQRLLDAKTQEYAALRTLYEQSTIKAALVSAASEAINPEMVLSLLGGHAAVAEDGQVTINGKPAQAAVTEYLDQNPFLAKPRHTGSGSGAGQSYGSAQPNPWRKETFNLTEQSRIARQNPTEAERLKTAAGA